MIDDVGCVAKTAVREKDSVFITETARDLAAASTEAFNLVCGRLSGYINQNENSANPVTCPPCRSTSVYFCELETYLRDIRDNLNGIREAFERAEI